MPVLLMTRTGPSAQHLIFLLLCVKSSQQTLVDGEKKLAAVYLSTSTFSIINGAG